MNLELSNPSIFKDVFDCIGHIVDEVRLDFDNEGVHLSALDKSHITFVNLEFKPTLFDSYEINEPKNVFIDTDQFMKILKRCKNSDILKLSIDDGNIILIFEGDATRKYNIRILDSEYEAVQPPMVETPCNIKIPSNVLKDSLGDLGIFSDNIRFICDGDYLRLTADGSFGDSEVKYLHGEKIETSVASKFSISKLEDIVRASKVSEECQIGLGDDMPLKVTFELITGDGEIGFLLAPRLNEEDL